MSNLLAKSGNARNPERTLVNHTQDVLDAVTALFGTPDKPSLLAREWCAFFGIADRDVGAFVAHVRLAAFCHDWGKANDGFQGMLAKKAEQLLRHEQVSAILMSWPSVWAWLETSGLDLPLILSAVVGHHLKCRDIDLGAAQSEVDQLLRLRWDDPGFNAWLSAHGPSMGLDPAVPLDVPKGIRFDPPLGMIDLQDLLDNVASRLDTLDRNIRKDDGAAMARRRMLWAVRAGLVVADSAGSGLPRNEQPIGQWIAGCMTYQGVGASTDGRMTGEAIRHHVIRPRMKRVGISDDRLNIFQKACAGSKLSHRALLMMPCGSGKTLAAWQWIAAQLDARPRGRAIFLYPTRGTATEGYRDYAGLAGEEMAALVHGTADLDLDGILGDASSERRLNEARLFALRQWPKRIFTATVDQFLAFMQHGYAATCQLPLLVDSVLVLDEIHSYDRGMWSALLEFLKCFPDVPVLCMTATLLRRRIEDLRDAGINVVDALALGAEANSSHVLAAAHPRYEIRSLADRPAAMNVAADALQASKRVLWVVNTVDECQSIARAIAEDPDACALRTPEGVPVYCYHSRYRLGDRNKWHEKVISAFKGGGKSTPMLAVTTQVCEMSLDLDADVLITEACPATALVQRLGRCCRDSCAHESGRPPGQVFIYPPERILPYTKQDMEGVDRLVETLVETRLVSQARLAELLDGITPPIELPKACRFTESGVWAASGEEQFRDASDISRQALLANDVDKYRRLRDPRKRGDTPPWKAEELVISLPRKFTQDCGEWGLPDHLKLAHGGTYRPALGYCGGDVATHAIA